MKERERCYSFILSQTPNETYDLAMRITFWMFLSIVDGNVLNATYTIFPCHQGFNFPLTVVMYHLIVKWILSVLVRLVLYLITGMPQLMLPFMTCLRSVGPTGLASGIDVGFSNWGLELVTISLYTMTKSTTIIFILGFAILLGLEKKVSVIHFLFFCF
jgi:hypothetical protein